MATLTNGLYPDSHGITDNYFYDENGNRYAWSHDPANETNAQFYNKTEPIWLTNQKQGGKFFNWLSLV